MMERSSFTQPSVWSSRASYRSGAVQPIDPATAAIGERSRRPRGARPTASVGGCCGGPNPGHHLLSLRLGGEKQTATRRVAHLREAQGVESRLQRTLKRMSEKTGYTS